MEFPQQLATSRPGSSPAAGAGAFDPRDALTPRRLTMAMWDQAFLLRHGPGGSFEDWPRALDQTLERGYNTVRLDPMPQWIDLADPDRVLKWPDPQLPYMPWNWNAAVECPAGRWLIDFMAELLARPGLHYTLSGWWFCNQHPHLHGPAPLRVPQSHADAAEMWAVMLRQWRQRFGFDRLVYLDLVNEVPYFLPNFQRRMQEATGRAWGEGTSFSAEQAAFLADDLNAAMRLLRGEFPELRLTASIHGDVRWLDVPAEFDCLDVHFYADADPRWAERTKFAELMPHLFTTDDWHADFSDRCAKAAAAVGPMLRARQRAKLADFAAWANRRGMPLTTTESWASWFYYDAPGLDWGWLLDWAEWSVEDAIEFRMWGWTPHNYVQPQFANWADVRWHRRLNDRFLRS